MVTGILLFTLISCKGRITGMVTDRDSGLALSGVGVEVLHDGGEVKKTTDAYGDFQIKNVPSGKASIVFKKQGYIRQDLQVAVPGSGTVSLGTIRLASTHAKAIYSAERWVRLVSRSLLDTLKGRGYNNKRFLITLWDKTSKCSLSPLTSHLITVFNGMIPVNSNFQVVNRNPDISREIEKEIERQLDNQGDFNQDTLVALGEKFGANVLIYGEFYESRSAFNASVNGLDISKQIYLPGLSINKKVKRSDIRCR